jgi:hypothetical protein
MPPGFVSAKKHRHSTPSTPAPLATTQSSHKDKSTAARRTHRPTRVPAAFGDSTETGPAGSATKRNATTIGKTTTQKNVPAGREGTTGKNIPAAGLDTAVRGTPIGKDPAAKKNAPPLPKLIPRKDSSHKKPSPPPEESKEKDHGWVFGVGLNQFFPIGGQRGSTYNSDGLTGTLTDYLPVPMIRYYINHKTYLQVEAQLNTPQATKKDLVFNSVSHDTTSIPGKNVETSATIQQLYYFNIPLSFHYAPTDDLNFGVGIQYSHLSNAIGNFDSTITSLTGPSSAVDANATKSFRGDTLYQRIKTNEFRFLIDASYTWKHFVVGLRYNQALTRFINVQLPTGGSTQSRNSSLQLYVRYILWDTRKKKPLSTK